MGMCPSVQSGAFAHRRSRFDPQQVRPLYIWMYTFSAVSTFGWICALYKSSFLFLFYFSHKKESQLDAYHKAYEVLISTPLETIVSENHRLNREELEQPDVQDVVIKGRTSLLVGFVVT
jgi:hypothetical protein